MRSRVRIPSATPIIPLTESDRNPADPVRGLRAVVRLAALARSAGAGLRRLLRPPPARGAGSAPPHGGDARISGLVEGALPAVTSGRRSPTPPPAFAGTGASAPRPRGSAPRRPRRPWRSGRAAAVSSSGRPSRRLAREALEEKGQRREEGLRGRSGCSSTHAVSSGRASSLRPAMAWAIAERGGARAASPGKAASPSPRIATACSASRTRTSASPRSA